jgi:hypothetical protein
MITLHVRSHQKTVRMELMVQDLSLDRLVHWEAEFYKNLKRGK